MRERNGDGWGVRCRNAIAPRLPALPFISDAGKSARLAPGSATPAASAFISDAAKSARCQTDEWHGVRNWADDHEARGCLSRHWPAHARRMFE